MVHTNRVTHTHTHTHITITTKGGARLSGLCTARKFIFKNGGEWRLDHSRDRYG